jgi:hypothetical protein
MAQPDTPVQAYAAPSSPLGTVLLTATASTGGRYTASAGLGSGVGPLSVRVCHSGQKPRARREPCLDQTQVIPCNVRADIGRICALA